MIPRLVRLSLLLIFILGGGVSPVRSDSPAQTIVEPESGRQPVLDFIGSAQSSVDLAIYEISDGRVLAALESAAQRGVRVRVLAEPLPGGHTVNARALAALQGKGVRTEASSPRFRLTHEKVIAVDGASAMIMSLNLVAQTFTSSRDVALVDADPGDVAEIEAVFDADWNRQAMTVSQPSLVWSPDNARARIVDLLGSAASEIDVYAEELLDRQMIDLLETAAVSGVRVRLLMTDVGSGDSSRPGRAALAAAGGEVRLLQKPFVHAKVILVDGGQAFLGSENLSAASLDQNRELGLLTADPSILSRLGATFEQDWDRAAPASN